jgi:hypothetical protein
MIIKWPQNKNIGDVYVSPNGAKWKWNGKAWISLRETIVERVVVETVSTVVNQGSNGITYKFSHSPMDPVDNMNYYIGDISDSPAQSNNSTSSKRVKSLIDGKVSQVNIMTQILNNLGSSESQTFTLKNHTKGTSAVITSEYKNLTNSQLDNFVLETPLAVSTNDELYIVWSVGIFLVSPISVRHNFNIYIG